MQHVSCHIAYHVTCGFQHNLLMRTKLDVANTGSVIHEVGHHTMLPTFVCVTLKTWEGVGTRLEDLYTFLLSHDKNIQY